MTTKELSPFTPGNPVPVELFVGRENQISEVMRYVQQASSGRPENAFLYGDRGIGKSSVASFLRQMAVNKFGMLGIHVFLGGVSSVDEMVRRIFDQLLKEAEQQTWFENIKGFFGKHIEEVGLFGVSLKFAPPKEKLRQLSKNYPEAISNLFEKIKKEKKGLFIVLDDINGLAEKKEFANWYKSFVDEVATHYSRFPVFTMLVGIPENRDTLATIQHSLMRIFRIIEIGKLQDKEVNGFFRKAFGRVKAKVDNGALEIMTNFSGGLPILMDEIGDAVFWDTRDDIIKINDAIMGIAGAALKVGQKYIDPKVTRTIRSNRYRTILNKLTQFKFGMSFTKKEIINIIGKKETKVLNNFLRRFREIGIIEVVSEAPSGTYRFVNQIYPLYIAMSKNLPSKK